MPKLMDAAITAEIRRNTANLPPYAGGPAVDYTEAPVSYAVNVNLVHDPAVNSFPSARYQLPAEVVVLLGKRASGLAKLRTWSGISGFVDRPDVADPIRHAIQEELTTECRLSKSDMSRITFFLGRRFEDTRSDGRLVHVLPVLGWCGGRRPNARPDGRELSEVRWVPFSEVPQMRDLSDGYLSHTLPRALGAMTTSHR